MPVTRHLRSTSHTFRGWRRPSRLDAQGLGSGLSFEYGINSQSLLSTKSSKHSGWYFDSYHRSSDTPVWCVYFSPTWIRSPQYVQRCRFFAFRYVCWLLKSLILKCIPITRLGFGVIPTHPANISKACPVQRITTAVGLSCDQHALRAFALTPFSPLLARYWLHAPRPESVTSVALPALLPRPRGATA